MQLASQRVRHRDRVFLSFPPPPSIKATLSSSSPNLKNKTLKQATTTMSSSPFPSCFRPSPTTDAHPPPPPPLPPPPPHSTISNLTLYHTEAGPVSLTWSRSIVGRSLHIQLHPFDSPPFLSFHLHIRPFLFWKKHGAKRLASDTHLFWNLSKARFGPGPEPVSGFYVALVVRDHMTLLIGDAAKDAYSKSRAREPKTRQFLLLKKEHVLADRVYSTRATFGGKAREIQIDCGYRDHSRLCFSVDGEKVLQIKRLKWKFRGNERVQVDGVHVQISWDLYNWLFDKDNGDAHAIFMFKFEEEEEEEEAAGDRNLVGLWNLGVCEWGKVGKSWSSSSVSSSAGSFGGSSSVLEWSSVEENELVVPVGFSLLVYASKR
ncbi:kinesin heavy chain [Spatholobus suberectus]|nr:kinesin heavy chain [Spatholobus suberectus]